MSVLFTNADLGVRRRVTSPSTNAHGEPVPAGWGAVEGDLLPGRVSERADGGWNLGVDPALWPLRVNDLVIALDGRAWLVLTADLIQNNMDHRVDWIRVDGAQRSVGGTEPGGAWFVARYADSVSPVEPGDPDAPPFLARTGLWTGYGPPPEVWDGVQVGDEYMDLYTGAVYRYNGSSQ